MSPQRGQRAAGPTWRLTVLNSVACTPSFSFSRTKKRMRGEAVLEPIREPRAQVRLAVTLTQIGFELFWAYFPVGPEPSDDFIIQIDVPLLITIVRVPVGGSCHEARIPLGVMTLKCGMPIQFLRDALGDGVVELPRGLRLRSRSNAGEP